MPLPPQTPARAVATAYGRAVVAQFTSKMLLLSILPFVLSLLLWGGLLYAGFQPLVDYVQHLFDANGWFQASSSTLAAFGMGMLKTIVVPLVAMLLLLPLMILTALIFMGVAAMPAIVRHVGERQFPDLQKKHGGSFLGSLATNAGGFLIFALAWLGSLPLYLVAPLAVLVQIFLWGWLTARVMTYDALAEHASEEEREAIRRRHKLPLLAIGMVSGACGALPGIVWIGGAAISFVLFPFLAALSIWLYLVIFIFTGLWFEYYSLQALADLRAQEPDAGSGVALAADA